MEFKEVINKRKSIRLYEPTKLPKKLIEEIIRDASKAPSAANWQPWEFHVVCDSKIMDKIKEIFSQTIKLQFKEYQKLSKRMKKEASEFYSNLGGCQHIILVYIDNEKRAEYRNSKVLSVAAAVENLILSATDKGIGTCWMGSCKTLPGAEKKITKLLGIKRKELITGVLIGYTKKGYSPLTREKKEIKEILKFI
jgi:nitroreductase